MFTFPLYFDDGIVRHDILLKAGGANDAKYYDRFTATEEYSDAVATTGFDDIVCSSDAFFLAAVDGSIYRSPKFGYDGTWSDWEYNAAAKVPHSIAFNPDGRIVVGYQDGTDWKCTFTTDGSTWTSKTWANVTGHGVAYVGSRFITVYYNSTLFQDRSYLNDISSTWVDDTTTTSSLYDLWTNLSYYKGRLMMFRTGNFSQSFDEGEIWQNQAISGFADSNPRKNHVRHFDGKVFLSTDSTKWWYTSDGETWSSKTYTFVVTDILYSFGEWFIVNNAGTIYKCDIADITTAVSGDWSVWKSSGLSDSTGQGAIATPIRHDI